MNSYAARSVIHVPVPYNIKLHTVLRSPRFDYRVRRAELLVTSATHWTHWTHSDSPSARLVLKGRRRAHGQVQAEAGL